MYYILLFILILFCLIELIGKPKNNILFYIVFIQMLFFLSLRYGQGSDYFGYMTNYLGNDVHSEIGYKLLSNVCKNIGCPFEIFCFFIACFQMICIYNAIIHYSPYKSLSLLLTFPTIFLTYFFSALRQGVLIAFFLGFMLRWIEEKKWLQYYVACLVLMTIHSAAIILLIIPFIIRIYTKYLYLMIGMAVIIGCTIYYIPKSYLTWINIGAVQHYLHSVSISYFGLLERIGMFIIITILVSVVKKNDEIQYRRINFFYKIYIYGFILSIVCMPWSLLSSRLSAPLKAVEILLIPILIKECRFFREVCMTFIICYTLLMTTKNIASYIQQGNYEGYNILTYPYITVFNKELAHQIRKDEYQIILNLIDKNSDLK